MGARPVEKLPEEPAAMTHLPPQIATTGCGPEFACPGTTVCS